MSKAAYRAARRAENQAVEKLSIAKLSKPVKIGNRTPVDAGWDNPARIAQIERDYPGLRGFNSGAAKAASKSMSPLNAAKTAYGVIAARDTLDNVTHSAADLVSNVPVLGEAARVAEDILQVSMNPWTTLATPLYAPYRAISGIVNEVTGRKEPYKPYDFRPTVGNVIDKLEDADIPILSPAAKLLGFIL